MTLPRQIHAILRDLSKRAPGNDARWAGEMVRLVGTSGEYRNLLYDEPTEDECEAALRSLWATGRVEYTSGGWRYGGDGQGDLMEVING